MFKAFWPAHMFIGGLGGHARTTRQPRFGRTSAAEVFETRTLLSAIPFGAVAEDTNEFMLGTVYVTVVFLESDGNIDQSQEDWTLNQISQVKQKIRDGLKWWEDTLALQNSVHELNFILDFTYADSPVNTPYEPISRPTGDENLWIDSFLKKVEFNTAADFRADLTAFNHSQRTSNETHWAFTLFVVNAENDKQNDDGWFADGGMSYASTRGRAVIQSWRDAATVAHEVGHVFYNLDEYPNGRSYYDRRGYYNTQNLNAYEDHPAPETRVVSLMAETRQSAWDAHTSSPTSLEMLGWQDSDSDGIFDVLDAPLMLEGAGAFNSDSGRYEFIGTSAVQTLPNQNSSGLGNDITLNRISRAQYRLDGGAWLTAATFDSYTATLDLSIGPLSPDYHEIDIRTIDDATGVTSSVFSGTTARPTATLNKGINGFVWNDDDADGLWDPAERGLDGRTVALLDSNLKPVPDITGIEPDDFGEATVINSIVPEATLTAIGNDVIESTVTARTRNPGSTGVRVFCHLLETGWNSLWNDGSRRLRVDFATPMKTVTLDALSGHSEVRGRLEIYDAAGTLLDTYVTASLAPGDFEAMTLSRSTAEIAYVIAGADVGKLIRLDNLAFSKDTTATTGRFGNYVIPNLSAAEYVVALVPTPNWSPTEPISGQRNVTVASGQAVDNVDFGTQTTNSVDGTAGDDAFVLTYSSTSTTGTVSVSISTDGGPTADLGTFPMNVKLALSGLGGADSVRIVGTDSDDVITATSSRLTVNSAGLLLNSVESRTLAGGAGSDSYNFDADATLGLFMLDESSGGNDRIDFSLTTTADVSLRLNVANTQVVNANLSLKLLSGNSFESATGGSGNDTLIGNSRANTLSGKAGHDVLNGGTGNDTLIGGAGNDTYVFGVASAAEADKVTELANAGIDTLTFAALKTAVNLKLGTTVVQTVHTNRTLKLNSAANFEKAIGGSAGDTLTGNGAANTLIGNGGNDTLTGGAGNDTLNGNGGNDKLTGAAGNDILAGGTGNDIYVFGTASSAEADKVTEYANAGSDTLNFSALKTAVTLKLGTTVVQTVHTNRTLKLNSTANFEKAIGGTGNDTLIGNGAANTLTGNGGHDILVGNGGDDQLMGGYGRDILIGGNGLDTLNGGASDDILIAGRTTSDSVFDNLNNLRKEWISANNYATRLANIRAGVGASSASLKAKVNVRDDSGADDFLTGGAGKDWYFRALDDIITDLLTGELTDLL